MTDRIIMRHRYSADPEFPYDIAAWVVRPQECAGPNPNVAVSVDRLQELMDRCNARFGDPGKVIQNPPLKKPGRKR